MTGGSPSATVVPFPKSERQRAHAARMFAWEDQVRQDLDLSKHYPYALHVVVLFRKRMSQLGETPRVEHRWIAKMLGVGRATVQRAIEALIEHNHLECESGKSVGQGSLYRAKVAEGASRARHPGCLTHDAPGASPAMHQVPHQRGTRISSVDSLNDPGGRTATRTPGASGNAAGYRGNQADRSRQKTDGAVAERAVSRMLGRDGDDVLSVLFGSEQGRPLYQQLIETARVNGVNAHLLKKARSLYWELTPARNVQDAAQRLIARVDAEIDALEFEGVTIDGEATEGWNEIS
jgi:hypothetical protein